MSKINTYDIDLMPKVTSTVALIKHLVINDEQAEIQILNELFDKVALAIQTNEMEICLTRILNNQTYPMYLDTCHDLLCRKYYLSVSAEKRTFDEMNIDEPSAKIASDTKKLINTNRLIHIFWEYCDEKISILTNELIDTKIDEFTDCYSYSVVHALEIWSNTYELFLAMIRTIAPVIQYPYTNYPYIFRRYIFKGASFEDYLNKKFYTLIKKKLNQTGKTFDDYIKFCIKHLIEGDKGEFKFTDKKFLLRFAYLYNETIDGKDIKNYYLEAVKQYIGNIDFTKYYISGESTFNEWFYQEIKEQTLLSHNFSPTWMEPVKNMIIKTALMDKSSIAKHYKAFRNCGIDIYKNQYNTDFQLTYFSYISRGKKNELDEICSDIIYDEIKSIYDENDKTSVLRLFEELRYSVIFFSHIKRTRNCGCKIPCDCDSDVIPTFFRSAFIKLFQNEIHLFEIAMKYIEINMRMTLPQDVDITHFEEDLPIILDKLSIPPSITSLFNQVLFRRILMYYSSIIDDAHKGQVWNKMIIIAIKCFEYKYDNDWDKMFNNCVECLRKTISLHRTEKDLLEFYPLILKKDLIPLLFQDTNLENCLDGVKLPQEIQDMWDKFENKYKKDFLSKSMNKIITPMYGLQYCEVSTPFTRVNGEPLMLGLTLYQTCVLNEFNEKDMVSFPYLVETLNMKAINVKAILNSFLNYGFIKTNEDKTFSINESFVPDERKIKNGILRVVLSKIKATTKSLTPISITATENHPDGLSSVWKRELIKACIVRMLKSKYLEKVAVDRSSLFKECQPQLQGISIGEFKDALEAVVKERYVNKVDDDRYIFIE